MPTDINLAHFTLNSYVPAKTPEPKLELVYLDEENTHIHVAPLTSQHGQEKCPQLAFPFAQSALCALPIKDARILTSTPAIADGMQLPEKQVLELTFETSSVDGAAALQDYQPGDTIAILPRNSTAEVEQLLDALGIREHADSSCRLQAIRGRVAKVPLHIPPITTPRELLQDCLNVRAVPKKQLLRALADCCTASAERDFLSCLSAKEGNQHYTALMLERGITLLQLLQLCTSCKPTLALLAEHLPRLLPRPYSIANSPLCDAHGLKIYFSVRLRNPGVTTRMLQQLGLEATNETHLQTASTVSVYLRVANRFRYTAADAADSNQLLIAIGTGLAPFLGFLEHKAQLLQQNTEKQTAFGQTWLFAGASDETALLQRARLLQLQNQGVLERYFESFSRVPNAPYRYVQDQMTAHAAEFVEQLLRPQTVLYVCADGAAISRAIEASIAACLQSVLQVAEAETLQMLKEFRASGKYREDLWA